MMDAGGLTPTRKFLAVIVGIVITLAYVFVTMPHPVSVPQQIITPVPTPPPVVITSTPSVPVQQHPVESSGGNSVTGVAILILLGIGSILFILVFLGKLPIGPIMGIIISMIGVIISLWIVGIVLDVVTQQVYLMNP
jgi:hypothetical protein